MAAPPRRSRQQGGLLSLPPQRQRRRARELLAPWRFQRRPLKLGLRLPQKPAVRRGLSIPRPDLARLPHRLPAPLAIPH